jgi:hypothetical protein
MNENIVHHHHGAKDCCFPLVACLLACFPLPPQKKNGLDIVIQYLLPNFSFLLFKNKIK